jgi:pyrroline-5-carboxylate reductase
VAKWEAQCWKAGLPTATLKPILPLSNRIKLILAGWKGKKTVRLYADCAAAIADDASFSTMIVLAVKPQMMADAIAGLGVMKHADCAYLSIAAGISTGWMKQRLGDDAIVIRAMPNTPAAIGKGITALYADAPNHQEALL